MKKNTYNFIFLYYIYKSNFIVLKDYILNISILLLFLGNIFE